MYEIFLQLLQAKGISTSKMCADLGINRSSINDWKKGRSVPKLDKMMAIADYFGVPLEYLLTGETRRRSESLTVEEEEILEGYHAADEMTREMVRRLLAYSEGIKKDGGRSSIKGA